MTERELAEIGARATAATQPTSFGHEDDGPHCLIGDGGLLWCRVADAPGRPALPNATFFAHARRDALALLAEVRRLRAVAAELLEEYRVLRRWAYGEADARSEAACEEELRQEVERWRARIAGDDAPKGSAP